VRRKRTTTRWPFSRNWLGEGDELATTLPLIIRGRKIEGAEREFAAATVRSLSAHLFARTSTLNLRAPSHMSDLHELQVSPRSADDLASSANGSHST